MADYCKECSVDLFNSDFKELANLSTEEDTKKGLFANVICEGCGFVQVDHTGKCLGGANCTEGHSYEP